jgi:uncharacterized protein DUF6481
MGMSDRPPLTIDSRTRTVLIAIITTRRFHVRDYRGPTPAERQAATTKARTAAAAKLREKARDPAVAEQKAKHAKGKAERTVAKQTRDRERAEKQAREADLAEQADRAAADQAARDLEQKRLTEIAEAADRKAARDARYAARKLRKRQ